MSTAPDSLIQRALDERHAGRWQQAEACCRQALQQQPQHVDALHLLGLILWQSGRPVPATTCIVRAICLSPGEASFYSNLGPVLRAGGKLAEAASACLRALRLLPQFPEAWRNLGNARKAQEELEQAGRCYRHALALQPDHPETHNILGNTFTSSGAWDAAQAAFLRALALRPDYADACANLGSLYYAVGRLQPAADLARRAILLQPGAPMPYHNLGFALASMEQARSAIPNYRRALRLQADFDETGRPEHWDLTLDGVLQATAAVQASPEVRYNIGMLLLGAGNLDAGWRLHEFRFFSAIRREFPYPTWSGQSLSGKAILIWGEQGVGDETAFASLYAEMIAQAERCVIECSPKLQSLFARNFPRAQVVAKAEPPHPATQGHFDYQSACGSLARWLRPTLDSFPRHTGYLRPQPARVAHWRARLDQLGPGPKVGISWRSSNMSGSRALSHTRLEQWAPILAVPEVCFVNLQYDDCAAELDLLRQRSGLTVHAFAELDLRDDIEDTAALMAALDLVISTSSFTGVLAPALGVPTWLMIQGVYRETLGTDHLPMYPAVRLFHRAWNQPWESLIAQIADLLKSSAASAITASQP